MNSNKKTARIAGIAYLLDIILNLLSMLSVNKLIVEGNATATANNIKAYELLFRIGIINELMVFINVIVLALVLYTILKTINKNFALLALYLRLAEAIVGIITVFFGFIVLQILNSEAYLSVFKTKQLQALIGLFINVRTTAYNIPVMFCSLGSIVFFYLFFKAKYIPKILASYGILSSSLMLIYSFIKILLPNLAAMKIFLIICGGVTFFFELIIGLWFLIKGVDIHQENKPVLNLPE